MIGRAAFNILAEQIRDNFAFLKTNSDVSSFIIYPMSLRNDYEQLFVQHGISRQEVCSMTENEFQKTLAYFLEENGLPDSSPFPGITSQYRYISPKMAQLHGANCECEDEEQALQRAIQNSLEEYYVSNARNAKPTPEFEDNRIRDEQDHEYQMACEDAEQDTFNTRNQEIFNANEAIISQELQQERESAVIGRYYSLPPEPPIGTTIAIVLNGERYIRKFDPQRSAADVYSWVAGQTIHCDEGKLYFDEFELAIAGKDVVDPNRTLEDQGLTGRIMLQIVAL
jgi:hypothetical protein